MRAPRSPPATFDVVAGGHRLEAVWHGPGPADAATIVMLHEGLGCVAAWREWPRELSQATGLGVLAYSRWGYGRSEPVEPPRPLSYMHEEGLVTLPEVLDATDVREAILLGHSDGGSIAIVHAGTERAWGRVRRLVLLAPHVFCEDVSVGAISRSRAEYERGDLRDRLTRLHGENVEGAFWGWNRAWLDPGFRAWTIEEYLPAIVVPVLVVQGEDDSFGTAAQVGAIERGVRGPFTRAMLPRCGHAPQRERPRETTELVVEFVRAASVGGSGATP